jgi:hypothetical protein
VIVNLKREEAAEIQEAAPSLLRLYRLRLENEVDMGIVDGRSPPTIPISFLHLAESGRTGFDDCGWGQIV